jgi:hypothetical protein
VIRLLRSVLVTLFVGMVGAVAFALPAQAQTQAADSCVALTAATYTHTFKVDTGAGTATASITRSGATASTPLCGSGQKFSLVAYYAPSPSFALPQYVYDSQTLTLSGNAQTVEFSVQLPPCYTQVDFVFEGIIEDLRSDNLYGDKKVGSGGAPGSQSTHAANNPQSAWYNGAGTKGQTCTNPAAAAVNKCDGSGTVHLSNELPYAGTTFSVVRNGGAPASVAVAALGNEDLVISDGEWPVTVTGDNGFSKAFDWAWPSGVCDPPTLEVTPDCVSLVLRVTNPLTNKAITATATYGAESKQISLGKGETKTVTFPSGTGSATITLVGAPDWGPLTADFTQPANCELARTGTSVTTVVISGAALILVGFVMVFVVTRHVGRRRRAA